MQPKAEKEDEAERASDDPPCTVQVAVHTPAHSALGELLSYRSATLLPPGTLVRVPLGQREVLGVVWDANTAAQAPTPAPTQLRAIAGVLGGVAPLGADWRALVGFTARYYQRSRGEVALA
ncbi:MAG: primosomal protein N', partial [Giesbergeria sp.]